MCASPKQLISGWLLQISSTQVVPDFMQPVIKNISFDLSPLIHSSISSVFILIKLLAFFLRSLSKILTKTLIEEILKSIINQLKLDSGIVQLVGSQNSQVSIGGSNPILKYKKLFLLKKRMKKSYDLKIEIK